MDMRQENAIWELKEYDREQALQLQRELDCPLLTAVLLTQRGIYEPEQARAFLDPRLEDLTDPMMMTGMAAAVARIRLAIDRQEKMVIYGDYDVDGICSIVVLKQCLADLGLNADYYIPDRFTEGYGLNQQAVEELAEQGYMLMITVDCGITALEEAAWCRSHGLDLIITDHHTPQDSLPEAVAVINTKLDSIEAVKDLSGAATAFKLVQALARGFLEPARLNEWLDLVALATVADIVPLKGENRIFVKYGLEQMRHSVHIGIRSLLEEVDLRDVQLDSWHMGFLVAPKLNSAGRLDTARRSVELLLLEEPGEARHIARQLCSLNQERRQIEESIVEEAIALIDHEFKLEENHVLIVEKEDWHQGVVGIVASRLVERYNRPAIVISWDGEWGRGSARSFGDFNMHTALNHCQDCLASFGGHRMAAGLHIERNRLVDFRSAMNTYAASLDNAGSFMKKYRIDMELSSLELGPGTLFDIKRLKPFGEGNPGPQFLIKGAWMSEAALVGRGQEHLRFRLEPGRHPAIAFNLASRLQLPHQLCKQDFLFRLEENDYNGPSLQLKVRDIKSACQPDNPHRNPDLPGQEALLELFRQTIESLHGKKPVIYVYPSFRALQKHRPVINHYFRENQVVELHGVLDPEIRRTAEGVINRKAPRLLLTMGAYWERRLCNEPKTGTGAWTVYWWPLHQGEAGHGALPAIAPRLINGPRLNWQLAPDWETLGHNKLVCYANRARTLRGLPENGPPMFREAGFNQELNRREARRDYDRSPRGWLLTDGSHTAGYEYVSGAEAILLADCPFGLYELDALLPERADQPRIPVLIAYNEQDVTANYRFLESMYPSPAVLEASWRYICSQPYNRQENPAQVWRQELGQSAGKQLKKWELRPILQVLEDRGLLKYHLQGNIITIIIEDRQSAVYTDARVPLLEEGQAEMACLKHWLKTALNNQ